MQAFLNQPFPYLHQKRHLIFWILELLILVTLFEYYVEPFTRTYSEHKYHYFIICLFHAAQVTVVYMIVFFIIQFSKHKARWRYIDEAKYLGLMLLLLGLGNFLIRDLIYNADNWRWAIFWEEMMHGWIAGGLFYLLIINLNRHLFKEKKTASDDSSKKTTIISPVASDTFEVNADDIIAIKADGNYAVFYMISGEKMIRQTLDNVEDQLSEFAEFVRTHRAFIANKRHIINQTGNTAGYQLTMEKLPFKVPVSRSKTALFLSTTNQN